MNPTDEWLDSLLDDFGHEAANGAHRQVAILKARRAIMARFQAKELEGRIAELTYWTHRGSGQIEMSAEQVDNRIAQLQSQLQGLKEES